MKSNSKELLDLEGKSTASASSLESKLLFCKGDEKFRSQSSKLDPPEKKPPISSVPPSQFLGKVKDFLGVMAEANKKLELDVKNNPESHDLEALTGEESEYIEMDLMLGVAELKNEEAVAAAESALAGSQPVISLAASSSESESEDSSDEEESSDEEDDSDEDTDDDDDGADDSGDEAVTTAKRAGKGSSSRASSNHQPRKRSKIVELS